MIYYVHYILWNIYIHVYIYLFKHTYTPYYFPCFLPFPLIQRFITWEKNMRCNWVENLFSLWSFKKHFVQHLGSQHQQNLLLILLETYTALYMIIRLHLDTLAHCFISSTTTVRLFHHGNNGTCWKIDSTIPMWVSEHFQYRIKQ